MSFFDIERIESGSVFDSNDPATIKNAFERIVKMEQILAGKISDFNSPALPPVRSIIAWHKNLPGTPQTLSDNWMECDGSTINDPASPINGQTVPNLNGDARFLRGASTSGTEQADAFQGHYHTGNSNSLKSTGSVTYNTGPAGMHETDTDANLILGPKTDGSNGTPRTDSETRPINMSVVWIIRIK